MKVNIKKLLGIFFVVIIFILAFIYAFNKYQRWQEARKYPPIGEMVDINGHKIHIYSEGEGKETLVFLAGWSTSSPIWDFKALYSQFSDRYCIVVVERSGCGYSETSESPRDIDTVLEESRFALKQTGETGPYILVPHSVSGLEAIYWAQKYPNEVRAIYRSIIQKI